MARVNFNKTQEVSTDIIVHNVQIIDASGSMVGSKWETAVDMVNAELDEFKNQKNLTYTVIIFSNDTRIVQWKSNNPRYIKLYDDYIGNGTALHDAVGTALTILISEYKTNERFLVKILTDGEENCSRQFRAIDIKNLIKKSKELGCTVTFSGTASDVKDVITMYSIDSSNTFVHQNTAASLADYATKTRGATLNYFKSVAKGENTTKGFFKSITDDKTTN